MRAIIDDVRFAYRALRAGPGFKPLPYPDGERLVEIHDAWPVGAGLVVVVLAAFALTRFLASLLFGVSTFDTLTYALVPLLLVGVGLAACTLPAWRVTRISPVAALRHE